MSHYLLVSRDAGCWFIGPFDTRIATTYWAGQHWDKAEGDPRWQWVELTQPIIAYSNGDVIHVPVQSPSEATI